MITANVIQRTFHIAWGDGTGTAFAIDRAGQQYLVTAQHVVEGIRTGDEIAVSRGQQWHQIPVIVVGAGVDGVDVTVLACPTRLAPPLPLEASSGGLIYGQTASFLGFPFGMDSGAWKITGDFPVPFVKAGIVSAIPLGEPALIYIDGHGNKGFSGGPVVFVPNGRPVNELQVAGIVANYPMPSWEPIVNKHGKAIVDVHNEPFAFFPENPGLVVAYDVRHAIELIDANPVGFVLPRDQNDDA